MKKHYSLKRLFKAIFIGNAIKSLRPEQEVSGLTGQAMLSHILKSVGSDTEISYAMVKEDSKKLYPANYRMLIPWVSGAVVVISGVAYAAVALWNPAALPTLDIESPAVPLSESVDKEYAYVELYNFTDGKLMLWLGGATSGMDFSRIYCVNEAGEKVYAAEIKPEENLVIFQTPWLTDKDALELELYANDNIGNQIIITIREH